VLVGSFPCPLRFFFWGFFSQAGSGSESEEVGDKGSR